MREVNTPSAEDTQRAVLIQEHNGNIAVAIGDPVKDETIQTDTYENLKEMV